MIQSPSNEVTLIVHNTPKPPKYYKLNKRLIKIIAVLVPIMIIISVSSSLLYSVFLKNKINYLASSEPERIVKLKKVITKHRKEIKALEQRNLTMTTKLSKGSDSTTSVSVLSLFNVPTGIQDLRPQELIKVEKIQIESNENIEMSFDLVNNSPNGDKLSGYLTIVQYQSNLVQFYPETELSQKTLRLEFSKGESFGFTRFRSTKAIFKKASLKSAIYKLYIFSKTGDLLTYKQLGPFNIE